MIWVAGIVGFIGGFMIGQIILLQLLKGRSNDEILHNRQIKWTYGILNWIFAAIGAYGCVTAYQIYF